MQTQRVSAKAKSARLNDHWASGRMGSTIFSWDSTDNPLHRHENSWWEWICRKDTCDFEDMGRCPANHHKSQTNFSTYTEIVVALQMKQIQTKDWQMRIAPMVSCHSWHYRLCSLFISISKSGYGFWQDQPHFLQEGYHGWKEKEELSRVGFTYPFRFILQDILGIE